MLDFQISQHLFPLILDRLTLFKDDCVPCDSVLHSLSSHFLHFSWEILPTSRLYLPSCHSNLFLQPKEISPEPILASRQPVDITCMNLGLSPLSLLSLLSSLSWGWRHPVFLAVSQNTNFAFSSLCFYTCWSTFQEYFPSPFPLARTFFVFFH